MHVLEDCEDAQLTRMGMRARERVLDKHSSARRAEQFENYVSSVASHKMPLASPVLAATGVHVGAVESTGVQP